MWSWNYHSDDVSIYIEALSKRISMTSNRHTIVRKVWGDGQKPQIKKNTTAKRKGTKGQTMIDKKLHWKKEINNIRSLTETKAQKNSRNVVMSRKISKNKSYYLWNAHLINFVNICHCKFLYFLYFYYCLTKHDHVGGVMVSVARSPGAW